MPAEPRDTVPAEPRDTVPAEGRRPMPAEPSQGPPPAGRLRSREPSPGLVPAVCAGAAGALPGLVDGTGQLEPVAEAHLTTCLRCQAELARYRRLRRDLRKLQAAYVSPAPAYVRATVGAVEAEMTRRAHVALAAYVGGAVVATAASAAGMLVWATRRRVALAS